MKQKELKIVESRRQLSQVRKNPFFFMPQEKIGKSLNNPDVKINENRTEAKVASTQLTEGSTESTSSDDDYSLMILKNRLAMGEITKEEYEQLKKELA